MASRNRKRHNRAPPASRHDKARVVAVPARVSWSPKWERINLADSIAREHIRWAKDRGMMPGDFNVSLGGAFDVRGWDDVRFALGAMWLSLKT